MPSNIRCSSEKIIRTLFQSLFWWNMPSNHKLRTQHWRQTQFQSLFWWNMPSNSYYTHDRCPIHISFNPCFDGTCLQTKVTSGTWSIDGECFNPCFDGTCLQTQSSPACHRLPFFVSILVLMEHAFKPWTSGDNSGRKGCFNPCFDGTCLQTVSPAQRLLQQVRFQSLFWWNMPSNL